MVSLRTNRWKIMLRDGVLELYDLQTDTDELRDVAGEQPDVTARLGRSLETLLDALAAGAAPEVALDLPEAEQEAHIEGLRDLGYVQ